MKGKSQVLRSLLGNGFTYNFMKQSEIKFSCKTLPRQILFARRKENSSGVYLTGCKRLVSSLSFTNNL
jgi:hypothetical protein